MSTIIEQVDDAITVEGGADLDQARRVLGNPKFLALFGSQILSQVGGNMALFGLTVTVNELTNSSTAVSVLLLTFLVPAVVFGAIAGVFVDMFDRRWILISTNVARCRALPAARLLRRPAGAHLRGHRHRGHPDHLLRARGGGHDPRGRASAASS